MEPADEVANTLEHVLLMVQLHSSQSNGAHGSNFKVVELWAESRNNSKRKLPMITPPTTPARTEATAQRHPPLQVFDDLFANKLNESEQAMALTGNVTGMLCALVPGYVSALNAEAALRA